jgi:hypothetical protein
MQFQVIRLDILIILSNDSRHNRKAYILKESFYDDLSQQSQSHSKLLQDPLVLNH